MLEFIQIIVEGENEAYWDYDDLSYFMDNLSLCYFIFSDLILLATLFSEVLSDLVSILNFGSVYSKLACIFFSSSCHY